MTTACRHRHRVVWTPTSADPGEGGEQLAIADCTGQEPPTDFAEREQAARGGWVRIQHDHRGFWQTYLTIGPADWTPENLLNSERSTAEVRRARQAAEALRKVKPAVKWYKKR